MTTENTQTTDSHCRSHARHDRAWVYRAGLKKAAVIAPSNAFLKKKSIADKQHLTGVQGIFNSPLMKWWSPNQAKKRTDWGLEDFMNNGETQVNNAANLSWFMVTPRGSFYLKSQTFNMAV